MRVFHVAIAVLIAAASPASAAEILGSGSTFIYGAMEAWASAHASARGTTVLYHPVGSATGITEIRHAVVDFAVTEAPLNDAQLLRDGLAQFPLVIGGIVPVVNLDGVAAGQLRLTGAVLAAIYLGQVTSWDDPAIAALNPDLKLPRLKILPVHRSDGSGSSYVWSDYLSRISPEWRVRVGTNTSLSWPAGPGVKHNGGVAETVARIRGAIGYVDHAYATREKLAIALVRNQAGRFVPPGRDSFAAAAAAADWTAQRDFAISLTDTPAADGYPIVTASFVLIRAHGMDPDRDRAARAFFRWVLEQGGDRAAARSYLPLPAQLVRQIEASWTAETH